MNTLVRNWQRTLLALIALLACTGGAFAQTTAGISIEPDTLDFLQVKGGKFAIASFAIRNTMDSGRISGSIGDLNGTFKLETGGGSFDIGPGEIHVVSLRFTPSSHRLFTDSIAIMHNVNGTTSPIYVYLRGTGSDSINVGTKDTINLGISPAMVNFGGVRLGSSAYRMVTITNNSDSAQLIGSTTIGAVTGPFMLESGGGPFVLNPGESRMLSLRFMPTAEGSVTGTLVVAYNSTDSSGIQTVVLQGMGIQPTAGGRDSVRVAIQPGSINFGTVRVGQTSRRNFTIMNMSDSASISGLIAPLTAPFNLMGGVGTVNVGAGASQTVTVEFTPTAEGNFNMPIAIGYMANGSLYADTVMVYGNAIGATTGGSPSGIALNPSSIDFGTVNVGGVYQRSITLTNPSAENVLVGTVANPAAPYFVTSGAGSFTLAPGQTRTVLLTYSPTVAGTFTDNLGIAYNGSDVGGNAYITLSGNAVAAQSGVEDLADATEKAGYLLGQNHPNPFTGRTTIDFTVPKAGNVTLQIFNTRGEMVGNIVDAYLPAGSHTVTWNAEGMESGVYLYQLQSGSVTVSKRLTLTK